MHRPRCRHDQLAAEVADAGVAAVVAPDVGVDKFFNQLDEIFAALCFALELLRVGIGRAGPAAAEQAATAPAAAAAPTAAAPTTAARGSASRSGQQTQVR